MEDFVYEIEYELSGYDVNTSRLVILYAMEIFADLRHYPSSWTEEQKIADMRKNKAKIAMAAIEIDSKDGAENQLSHSENGISRTYSNSIMAYRDVIGFADCI